MLTGGLRRRSEEPQELHITPEDLAFNESGRKNGRQHLLLKHVKESITAL